MRDEEGNTDVEKGRKIYEIFDKNGDGDLMEGEILARKAVLSKETHYGLNHSETVNPLIVLSNILRLKWVQFNNERKFLMERCLAILRENKDIDSIKNTSLANFKLAKYDDTSSDLFYIAPQSNYV